MNGIDSFLGIMQWDYAGLQGELPFDDQAGHASFVWNIHSEVRTAHFLCHGDWDLFLWGSMRDPLKDGKSISIEEIAAQFSNGNEIEQILKEKEGEFLLAAWNRNDRAAFLAVDPLGHTKLFYSVTHYGVLLSSHTRLITAVTKSNEISPEGLNLYLSLRAIAAPYTALKGVFKVRPGCIVKVNQGHQQEDEYFPLVKDFELYEKLSLEEAQIILLEKLGASVKRSLGPSPCTKGLFLSGGLDSGLILALAARQNLILKNFTAGYDQIGVEDECKEALSAAEAYQAEISIQKQKAADSLALLLEVVPLLPEPVGDASFITQVALARLAAQTTSVMLDGTGADNLFGGLNKTIAESYMPLYRLVPTSIRQKVIPGILNLLPSTRKSALGNMVRKARRYAEGGEMSAIDRQIYWARLMPASLASQVVSPAWQPDGDFARDFLLDLYQSSDSVRPLVSTSYMSMKSVMPWAALYKLNTIEYLTGLSVREPYLTPDFVRFALAIPDHYKVHRHTVKYVLRKSSEKVFPKSIWERSKKNFTPPIRYWLRNEFREIVSQEISKDGPFNQGQLQYMFSQQQADWRDWQLELWICFIFQIWFHSSEVDLRKIHFLHHS